MDSIANPLVSVVFTSYNHREFLKQALDSIVAQTYDNLEIIVVDDCSTDGSQQVLELYRGNPKIRLHLLEKNTGSYVRSSNFGASHAKGDFLLFAQCDDYADQMQIENLVRITRSFEVGVVYSRSNLIDAAGNLIGDDFSGRSAEFKRKCAKDTVIKGREMFRFLSDSCVIPNLSAALIKRSLYLTAGRLPEKYLVAADWAFWLNLAELTDFYYLTKTLNNFRQHETTIRSKVKVKKQVLEIYSLFYDHLEEFKLTKERAFILRRGAGSAWFSFVFLGLGAWVDCFSELLTETKKYERNNFLFLIIGAMHFLWEALLTKINNIGTIRN